jgi:hypothetical protein
LTQSVKGCIPLLRVGTIIQQRSVIELDVILGLIHREFTQHDYLS